MRVQRASVFTTGTTPTKGTSGNVSRRCPIACTVAVLQAATIILASRASRNRAMRSVRSRSSAVLFSPYGTWPLSARNSMLSCGSSLRIARQMESPPTPESNMPIGLLSIA